MKEDNFEQTWRKAFEDAQDVPSEGLWARIEQELDEDDDRLVVLPWWRQTGWLAAAGVSLLVVALGGWWWSQATNSALVANHQAVEKNELAIDKTKRPTSNSHTLQSKVPALSSEANADNKALNTKSPAAASQPSTEDFLARNQLAKSTLPSKSTVAVSKKQPTSAKERLYVQPSLAVTKTDRSDPTTLPINSPVPINSPLSLSAFSTPVLMLDYLDGKPLGRLPTLAKRIPWVSYQQPAQPVVDKLSKSKIYFASLNVMPASFNSGLSNGNSNSLAYANNSSFFANQSRTAPSEQDQSKAAFSVAVQWNGGVQLSNRWSLETGVNFLQGNSFYQANTLFDYTANRLTNALEESVVGSTLNQLDKSQSAAPNQPNSNKLDGLVQLAPVSFAQAVRNDFQYLQVPMQFGFNLIPKANRLNLSLLGGVMSNIFLQNRLETATEADIVTRGSNSAYRSVSWAATTGVRVQYRLNKQWATQLTGNYQQALQSATQADNVFQMRPSLLGVGLGMRYQF